jgi:hypothetical protein
MGRWMDLKNENDAMKFKIGEEVICIIEEDIPACIGKIFRITSIKTNLNGRTLYVTTTMELPTGPFTTFPFFEHEIAKVTSLIKELV